MSCIDASSILAWMLGLWWSSHTIGLAWLGVGGVLTWTCSLNTFYSRTILVSRLGRSPPSRIFVHLEFFILCELVFTWAWDMPNALEQQQRLLAGQSRFPPARSREEDTSSVISWNTVQSNAADPDTDEELPMPPADLKVSRTMNMLHQQIVVNPLQLPQHRLPEIWLITPMKHLQIEGYASNKRMLGSEVVEVFGGSNWGPTTRSMWSSLTIFSKWAQGQVNGPSWSWIIGTSVCRALFRDG